MNEQQFWALLQQSIYQSLDTTEITQAQWERLVQLLPAPPLPTQLIIQTVCKGSIYLAETSPLNFPAITPDVSLSANQHFALEMALSNSAIALIVGSPGTGKTRIATSLAAAATHFSQRVLLLTHHRQALSAYHKLSGYPLCCQQQDYCHWLIEQLRSQHLAQPQMDYLPLHLLPDRELTKLRTPARLERWLPIIQTTSKPQLIELLQQAYPDLISARVQLLACRLKQLEPLLQQQLRLSQLYANLSAVAITELANQLIENSQVPIVGTVGEFMEVRHQSLWQTSFDMVIVEEAQHLTWLELLLLSGLGHKLVLFGDEMLSGSPTSSQQSFFTRFPQCFHWLTQHLLPSYICQLTEQFRLHPEIANLVYPVICNDWIITRRLQVDYNLPQLRHRLVWQDVPNQIAGEQILKFLQRFAPQIRSQIGIITFDTQERDWLKANSPQDFSEILIATVAEWAGIERAIAIISCVGHRETITPDTIHIALTRGQDYLILFGDYDFWWQVGSPLRSLLAQGIHTERMVVFS